MNKIKKYLTNSQLRQWSNSFSMAVLKLITGFWVFFNIYILILITIKYFMYGILEAEVMTAFIDKMNGVFLASVVSIVISRTFGNIFQYNDGGIFGISNYSTKEKEEEANG